MNNIVRDYKNDDGTVDTMIISSNDNYMVNLNGGYVLANKVVTKKNVGDYFKNSILGADIGINSNGFMSVAMVSFVIAVLAFVVLYFSCRI